MPHKVPPPVWVWAYLTSLRSPAARRALATGVRRATTFVAVHAMPSNAGSLPAADAPASWPHASCSLLKSGTPVEDVASHAAEPHTPHTKCTARGLMSGREVRRAPPGL